MNILSASLVAGCFGIVILFIISFLAVHAPFLLQKWSKKEREIPPVKEEPKKKIEPVYYIVEKKKKRIKQSYSEPKQIHFK